MKKNIFNKVKGLVMVSAPFCLLTFLPVFTSCGDFFEQESENIVNADKNHLNSSVDTVFSAMGILNKLQVIADRTILLGEVRGDLVDLTNKASADLRAVAQFNIGDDNKYNSPRDYYAVINNCNYYLKYVNKELRNNRNEPVFMKEYAAIKAIRAWTYLQLALNYEHVPFFTEPLLTKEAAEAAEQGEKYDLKQICEFFLDDLSTLPQEYNYEYPGYREVRSQDSRFFWFPLNILRGDMNLWLGNYEEAAKNYYDYISQRYSAHSYYPSGLGMVYWAPATSNFMYPSVYSGLSASETYNSNNGELITMIPGDSIPAEGYYSELRNLFTSTDLNDYRPSITASNRIKEISAAQRNTVLNSRGTSMYYANDDLTDNLSGDLRLQYFFEIEADRAIDKSTGKLMDYQYLTKYNTRNVHIYRRQMVYLRLAEALNLAGYPHMAFTILKYGLSNQAIGKYVLPYYPTQTDSLKIAQFDFDDSYYKNLDATNFAMNTYNDANTIGMHSRGSGWAPLDTLYVLPNDTIENDAAKRAQLMAEHQAVVDSLILNEEALEFAFEGIRYYDLMRFALRRPNPEQWLADRITERRGAKRSGELDNIRAKLMNRKNWFLSWQGKIGYGLK